MSNPNDSPDSVNVAKSGESFGSVSYPRCPSFGLMDVCRYFSESPQALQRGAPESDNAIYTLSWAWMSGMGEEVW